MDSEVLIIERLHVDGLRGKHIVDLTFDEDVNILTGVNGAGKTTILDIAYSLLSFHPEQSHIRSVYKSAILYLSNNSSVSLTETNDVTYVKGGKSVTAEIFFTSIRKMAISSFDSYIPNIDRLKKMQEENVNLRSDLDYELNQWINIYHKYMTFVSREVESITQAGNGNMEQISALYTMPRYVFDLCSKLFGGNKFLQISQEGKLQVRLADYNDTIISPESLSSGEKQMLILLLSTLSQGQKRGIVFWDEPEVSLHIAWQQQLIRVMRSINKNMQLIIATHSPNILYEGWEKRVINLKNAISND